MVENMIRGKKGEGTWFHEHVADMIIAVVCLGLLFFVIGRVYSINHDSKIDQVTGDLEEIASLIKQVKSGIDGKILVSVPKNWQIVSFYQDYYKPVQCGKYCICICQDFSIDSCEKEEEYCADFNEKIVIRDGKIGIDKTIELKAVKIGEEFEVYKNA
ncbi:hypothetical protein COV15_02630 [Candidatus Woesearchaeota archaeon CG10_big_fil_rev_8_21_14_0_10_34_12]|nr:MAG: hypothetical protein COV15_02630 [Candidatus Woesearchaeota archaeon CG10_big_fil_rev_8_21_14_0_10_34_12]